MTRPAPRSDAHLRRDLETRQRLLEVATRLFSERGFRHVTVRDICSAAGANLASVNYHFGDKAQLYRHVVDGALAAVRPYIDESILSAPGASAADKLRHYIRTHIGRGLDSSVAGVAMTIRQLFRHEMTEPTELLSMMVEQALMPRLRYLTGVVTALIGPGASDADVQRCVISIHLQCLSQVIAPHFFGKPPLRFPDDRDALAEHVFQFSLAGVRAIGQMASRMRRRRRPR